MALTTVAERLTPHQQDDENSELSNDRELLGSLTRGMMAGGGRRFSARLNRAQKQLDDASSHSVNLVNSSAAKISTLLDETGNKMVGALDAAGKRFGDITSEKSGALVRAYVGTEEALARINRTATAASDRIKKLDEEVKNECRRIHQYLNTSSMLAPSVILGLCVFFALLLGHAFVISVYGESVNSRIILWIASGWGCFTFGLMVAVCKYASGV